MGQCDDPLSRHRTRDVGGDAPVHAAATVPDPTLDPYDGGAIAAIAHATVSPGAALSG